MQLNNLILVPISKADLTIFTPLDQVVSSPPKSPYKKYDDICWKKSLSAFKRFKGKKDK